MRVLGPRNIMHVQETKERKNMQKESFQKVLLINFCDRDGRQNQSPGLQFHAVLANVWKALQQRTREIIHLGHTNMSCSLVSLVMPGECPGTAWPWLGSCSGSHKYSCLQQSDDLSMSLCVYYSIVSKIASPLFKRRKNLINNYDTLA